MSLTKLYHGGCHGCAQSEKGGTPVCVGCQYFDTDWNLPDMNDAHERKKQYKKSERNRLLSMDQTGPTDRRRAVLATRAKA